SCSFMRRRRLTSTLFPYTTLFRSEFGLYSAQYASTLLRRTALRLEARKQPVGPIDHWITAFDARRLVLRCDYPSCVGGAPPQSEDRKSTRLNSSHVKNSYAVFCLK